MQIPNKIPCKHRFFAHLSTFPCNLSHDVYQNPLHRRSHGRSCTLAGSWQGHSCWQSWLPPSRSDGQHALRAQHPNSMVCGLDTSGLQIFDRECRPLRSRRWDLRGHLSGCMSDNNTNFWLFESNTHCSADPHGSCAATRTLLIPSLTWLTSSAASPSPPDHGSATWSHYPIVRLSLPPSYLMSTNWPLTPLAAGNGHAYNLNGNIAMFNRIDGDLTVFIHETAHSLDLLGAYEQSTNALSSSQAWLDNYAQDPNIPDGYAQSSMLEDVAQSSVVTAFNLNVPGGYGSVETNYEKIFHQYATIQTAQANAGNLLVPGGQCKSRLPNSSPVPQQSSSTSRVMKREEMGEKPNVALEAGLKVIEGKEFDTSGSCQHTRWLRRDGCQRGWVWIWEGGEGLAWFCIGFVVLSIFLTGAGERRFWNREFHV